MAKPKLKIKPGVDKSICINCGEKIETMVFRGTGVCSTNCQKALTGEERNADQENAGKQ